MTAPDPLPAWAETDQLNAQWVALTLGLTEKELRQVLGDSAAPSTVPTSAPLRPLDTLARQLRDVFGSLETARIWLRAPNPVLDNEAPVAFLLRGDLVSVSKLLRMAENGMPT